MDKEEYQPNTDVGGKRMFAVQKTKNKEEYKVWVNVYHPRNPYQKTFNEIDNDGNEYRYTPTYEGELIARYKTRKEALERARRLNNGIPEKRKFKKTPSKLAPVKEKKKKPPPPRPAPKPKPQYSVRSNTTYNVYEDDKIIYSYKSKNDALRKVNELEQ